MTTSTQPNSNSPTQTTVTATNPFAALPDDSKQSLWTECIEEWLTSRKTSGTRNAYQIALREFQQSLGRPLWQAGSDEVAQWMTNMQAAGKSDNTVLQKLNAVSSLFCYALEAKTFVAPDGLQYRLADINPVKAVARPKTTPYSSASYLSKDQRPRLLRAIPRDTLHGKMHYALILCYMTTGRRNSEIRQLRWGDLMELGGQVFFKSNAQGKIEQHHTMPPHAWEAIVDYLIASGRYESMQDDTYIFTAMTDRVTRIKRTAASVKGHLARTGTNQGSWTPGQQPLSRHEVGRIAKMYARKIGIKDFKLSWLRYTFAEISLENGASVQKLQAKQGHRSPVTTMQYLDHSRGNALDDDYEAMADQLALDSIAKERREGDRPSRFNRRQK